MRECVCVCMNKYIYVCNCVHREQKKPREREREKKIDTESFPYPFSSFVSIALLNLSIDLGAPWHMELWSGRWYITQRSPCPSHSTDQERLFCPIHNQPHFWAYFCSLGDTPGSGRSSGAILWTSALIATLRFASSSWLSSPRGAALALGSALGGFSSSRGLKWEEVPFQVGYLPLKVFQRPEANLLLATPFKHSAPHPPSPDRFLHFLDIPALMYLWR